VQDVVAATAKTLTKYISNKELPQRIQAWILRSKVPHLASGQLHQARMLRCFLITFARRFSHRLEVFETDGENSNVIEDGHQQLRAGDDFRKPVARIWDRRDEQAQQQQNVSKTADMLWSRVLGALRRLTDVPNTRAGHRRHREVLERYPDADNVGSGRGASALPEHEGGGITEGACLERTCVDQKRWQGTQQSGYRVRNPHSGKFSRQSCVLEPCTDFHTAEWSPNTFPRSASA
jgi:hypothetical protein